MYSFHYFLKQYYINCATICLMSNILPINENLDSYEELPPALDYIAMLHPVLLTPKTFAGDTEGKAKISIFDPRKDAYVISIYRFIAPYLDGNYGVQDEIMFLEENRGAKMNFEFTADGTPVKYPEGTLAPLTNRAINTIRELSTVKGASIDAKQGIRYVSNGEAWVGTHPSSE